MITTNAGFTNYCRYMAIKLHFEGEYKYFRYGPIKNIAREKYDQQSRDYFPTEKFTKKWSDPDEATLMMAANRFAFPKDRQIGTLIEPPAKEVYYEYQKRKDARVYYFKEDLVAYKFIGSTENILNCIFNNTLAPDTFICYNLLSDGKLFQTLSNKFKRDTLIWPTRKKRLEALTPFLDVTTDHLDEIRDFLKTK